MYTPKSSLLTETLLQKPTRPNCFVCLGGSYHMFWPYFARHFCRYIFYSLACQEVWPKLSKTVSKTSPTQSICTRDSDILVCKPCHSSKEISQTRESPFLNLIHDRIIVLHRDPIHRSQYGTTRCSLVLVSNQLKPSYLTLLSGPLTKFIFCQSSP